MPSASVIAATSVKPGFLTIILTPYRKSCISVIMISSPDCVLILMGEFALPAIYLFVTLRTITSQ
jgi:hypothetical protein